MAWSDDAHEALSKAGYRRGGARQAVVELLGRQECALSAVEIEEHLKGGEREVARASVYRVLEQLEGLGMVSRLNVGGGLARFEPAHADGEHHHHHMVCEDCGELVPFHDDELEQAISRLSKRVSFDVAEHDVTLRGSCGDCRGGRQHA